MQSNEIISIDTRSLPEIYSQLPFDQRTELKASLVYRTGKTRRAVDNWTAGRVFPTDKLTRDAVVKTVNTLLRIRTSPATLIPVQ